MIVTPVKVRAYAHCHHALCPGYGQEEVDAVQTTIEYTYGDNGADMFKSMVERSTIQLGFENTADAPCGYCRGTRELSMSPRPTYQPLSGHDPLGLVNGSAGAFNPQVVNSQADADMAELRAQLKVQQDQIAALLGQASDVEGEAA